MTEQKSHEIQCLRDRHSDLGPRRCDSVSGVSVNGCCNANERRVAGSEVSAIE